MDSRASTRNYYFDLKTMFNFKKPFLQVREININKIITICILNMHNDVITASSIHIVIIVK